MRFLTAILILVMFALSAVRAEQHSKVFDAKQTTLENGMQVVVVENSRAPVITHMVWYKAGAADEPHGQSGIAHFLEHLLFKGSEGLEPGEFSRTVRALGGNDNAFTSYDYTAYFQSIAAKHLETVMRMEAGRMRGASPPLEEVDSERKVILEERSQRTDNNPSARFSEALNAALYQNHPYGIPIIGWRHEMEQLDWDIAKAFYDRWYAPNNAILIVSGDVQAEAVFALAREIYGTFPPSEAIPPMRQRTKIPPLAGQKRLEFSHPSLKSNKLSMIYRVPSYRQDRQSALALQVFEEIMGGGPTSRLYRALVVELKLATDIALYYQSSAIDNGEIHISAALPPGIAHETVQQAIEAELDEFLQNGATPEEVSAAIKTITTKAIYARDSVAGPAMIIGRALTTGSTLEEIESWPQQIAGVSAAQIQAAAQTYLGKDSADNQRIVGYLKAREPSDD